MKSILCFVCFFILITVLINAQQTINGTLDFDGEKREYILYIPEQYDASAEVPLVFNFHGFSSNATEQMWYGDFRAIADTANFIIVHPEGLRLNGIKHWNVGGFTLGSTVDDVGFINALIDQLNIEYNIDNSRIYATGMSNGGYMSFKLACELSERFAAIASVTGSMTPEIIDQCDPTHPMPIMQIHGTNDNVVPYLGALWSEPIDEILDYWSNFNTCSNIPVIEQLPNINTTDGSTVEHIIYKDCIEGITNEHFKVTGGDHTWPGTFFAAPGTNYDIDASQEIWKFFSRYNLDGLITAIPFNEYVERHEFKVFPNPSSNQIIIQTMQQGESEIVIRDILGRAVISRYVESECSFTLRPGNYLVELRTESNSQIKQIIIH